MNRGSAVSIGEPIWAIETQYAEYTRVKVFTSEAGFQAGLRAVKRDIAYYGSYSGARRYGAQGFRTFRLDNPEWIEVTP